MIRHVFVFVFALFTALGLSACTDTPQAETGTKADAPAWQGAQNAYVAEGWAVGDKANWDRHLNSRAQAQNEYLRIK
jgi:hypothetical protein